MGYDKIRDKMFDICQEYRINFEVYQQFIREGSLSVAKMTEKKLNKATKQLDNLLKKIPPNYRYKDDLQEMMNTLKDEREKYEQKFNK